MRNTIQLQVKSDQIIVAIDNVGSVGMKAEDVVKAKYEDVAYFAARTTIIECLGANGLPFSINLGNFCGDDHFMALTQGLNKAINEAGLEAEINGSSESNFDLKQSAVTVTTLAWALDCKKRRSDYNIAVIGHLLVGEEVLKYPDKRISLKDVKALMENQQIYDLFPVGSKGIKEELQRLSINEFEVDLDIDKSGGPSTAVIVTYHKDIEGQLETKFKANFNKVNIM